MALDRPLGARPARGSTSRAGRKVRRFGQGVELRGVQEEEADADGAMTPRGPEGLLALFGGPVKTAPGILGFFEQKLAGLYSVAQMLFFVGLVKEQQMEAYAPGGTVEQVYHNYYHNTSEGIDTPIDEAPGMLFAVSESLPDKYPENTEDQVLDLREFSFTGACEYDDRYEYDDGTYKGKYDRWINCGETNASIFILAALPEDQSHVAVIQVTAESEEDLEAQKHILDTFKVADDL